jgi:DNA-binding response OmpR family regulator
VITDLNRPGGDGVELATTIRRTSPVPIIVVTGYKNEFARRLRNVPDVVLLHKPFEAAELLNLADAQLLLHSHGRHQAAFGEGEG